MPFDWFVALRFLREGRTQTVLILVGVAFGVGVMVFLSALITGLQASLVRQTLGSQPHIVVRPAEEQARPLSVAEGDTAVRVERAAQRTAVISNGSQIRAEIEKLDGVLATAPTVAGSAFAQRGSVSKSIALRGIDPTSYRGIIPVDEKLRGGEFAVDGANAVIGTELAQSLGLGVGDRLRLSTAQDSGDVFTVRGIFDLGNKDVNQRWVFVSLRAAQTLLDQPGSISTVEVRVEEIFLADAIAERISRRTGLLADSWMKLNSQLLVGLKSQSSSSYMIQFFVMLAVTLGIASVLVVSVVQRSREIGILKAVGTSTQTIMRIFFIQGGLVGFLGASAGSVIGAVLSLFFASLARNPDGSPTFPVNLHPLLFLSAIGIATCTGLLAAVAPARRAARLDPAVVIRYG